jgi:PEGA domain
MEPESISSPPNPVPEHAITDPGSPPTLASVVFVRIVEFARRPVAEQARLRAQIEAALAVSLAAVKRRNRIVLDAPDGIVIAVLADPAAALNIAERCLNASVAGVPVAIAVNHGAIRLAPDQSGRQGLMGDALGTASAIAHFAGPARLFVSRSFRDALATAAPARALSLRPAGVFTDANLRTHELLSVDREVLPRRRRFLIAIGAAALTAIGATMANFRIDIRNSLNAGKPAVLNFSIYPYGEVFVDQVAYGKSPPLRELQLEPGSHEVELRKKGYPVYRIVVEMEPGKTSTLSYAFVPKSERSLFLRLRNWMTR